MQINDKGKEMMKTDFALIIQGVKGFFEEGKIPFQDFVEDYIGAIFSPAEEIPEFFIKNKVMNVKNGPLVNHETPIDSISAQDYEFTLFLE